MIEDISRHRYPVCFSAPSRLTAASAWHEHIPFAMLLVDMLRPTALVELGTYGGDSYCAFCQAVDELGLATKCYAVDTWQGDAHSGSYGPEILEELRKYHDRRYGHFSRLMPVDFDEAAATFEEGSIDLLHIDGNHRYESVKHDFDMWLPKMSRRGVILLHDICVRREDFGVWKLWDTVKASYPTFEFHHGHGLGLVAVGPDLCGEVKRLVNLTGEDAEAVRRLFAELGTRVAAQANPGRILTERARLIRERDELRVTAQLQRDELDRIRSGVAWRAIERLRSLRDRVLPSGRWPRRGYDFADRALRIAIAEGIPGLVRRAKSKVQLKYFPYELWISRNEAVAPDVGFGFQKDARCAYLPTISIVTPVYNPSKYALAECIQSVVNQSYGLWELCLIDGGSDRPYVRELIQEWAGKDPRIKYRLLQANLGIAGNSNEGLKMVTGEYVGFLDHDDLLAPFALHEVVKALNSDRSLDFLYSDEDKVSARSAKRYLPEFKSDWAPDTFLSYNYLCHFAVARKALVDEVGGFRSEFEGSQDYDLILRIAEKTTRIKRIAKVLYHWRAAQVSVAAEETAKPYAYTAAKKAIAEHLARRGLDAEVLDGAGPGIYRVKYRLRPRQRVSIIIPTKDKAQLLDRCVTSVLSKTDYPEFDVLIVDNQSREPETERFFDRVRRDGRVRILQYDAAFNFSAINNYAVRATNSDICVFLNNDTEVISSEWLRAMLEFAQREDVGAVGAKLCYPDDTIQHAGTIIGYGGVADHAHKGFPRSARGYMWRIQIVQNLSAVTAACMMVRRKVFDEVGGYDERLSHSFNDVDLCLKMRERGYLIVYTPYAELYHHESVSRGHDESVDQKVRLAQEVAFIKSRWKAVLQAGDPYYNPNLTCDNTDFSLRLS